MEFSRQESWSRLPFLSWGDLPNPGIKPSSPALARGFLTAEPPRLYYSRLDYAKKKKPIYYRKSHWCITHSPWHLLVRLSPWVSYLCPWQWPHISNLSSLLCHSNLEIRNLDFLILGLILFHRDLSGSTRLSIYFQGFFLHWPFPFHWVSLYLSFDCWCSVTESCLTLCDPMDCSTPSFPVLCYLPEFAQTHVHWVGDAIQPSHPLLSLSPPAFNLSQHHGLFQWVSSSCQVAKVLEFLLQHQSFHEYSGLISFKIDWLDLLAVQRTLKGPL